MRLIILDSKGDLVGASKTWIELLQRDDINRLLSHGHVMTVTDDQYCLLRDGKAKMMPLGLVLNEDEPHGPASKLAYALAEALLGTVEVAANGLTNGARAVYRDEMAARIDGRLAEVRVAYGDESLAQCPIVSHHSDPCAFCLAAAMRDFIQVKR